MFTTASMSAAHPLSRTLVGLSLAALCACGSSRRPDAQPPAAAASGPDAVEAPAPPTDAAPPQAPAAPAPIHLHLTDFRPTFDDPGCPTCTPLTRDHLDTITASSTLHPEARYGAANLLDGQRSTAWCEGAPGSGDGAWVELTLREPSILHTVAIAPGYLKSADTLFNNARPAKLRLTTDAGHALHVTLGPYPKDYVDGPGYALPATWPGQLHPAPVRTLRLSVDEVHPGRTHEDLCISALFIELLDET